MYPVSDWIQVRNGVGVNSHSRRVLEFLKFIVRIDFSNRYYLLVLLNINSDRMLYIIFVN